MSKIIGPRRNNYKEKWTYYMSWECFLTFLQHKGRFVTPPASFIFRRQHYYRTFLQPYSQLTFWHPLPFKENWNHTKSSYKAIVDMGKSSTMTFGVKSDLFRVTSDPWRASSDPVVCGEAELFLTITKTTIEPSCELINYIQFTFGKMSHEHNWFVLPCTAKHIISFIYIMYKVYP